MMSRRRFLACSLFLPALAWLAAWRPARGHGAGPALVAMRGTARGERVWFEPAGLWIPQGATVRFVNEDAVNVHTATAFHPDLHGRERRIPAGAPPWTSELLLPGEHYDAVLDQPGVYDYYCFPHAAHGMVGRIVVGTPEDAQWTHESYYQSTRTNGMPGTFPELNGVLATRSRHASG